MQPDQEIAGTNLSVNRLAIRRALNATGNEAEGVDQEIMRRRDVLVHQDRYDPLEFRHTHLRLVRASPSLISVPIIRPGGLQVSGMHSIEGGLELKRLFASVNYVTHLDQFLALFKLRWAVYLGNVGLKVLIRPQNGFGLRPEPREDVE
jgi:hypothetical protein